MSKVILNNIGDLTQTATAQAAINTNFNTLQTAFDNTLSRDGSSPNQMSSELDMNSKQIINLPAALTSSSPLRLQDLTSFIGGGTVTNIPAGGTAGQTLTKTSNANYAVGWGSSVTSVGLTLPADFTVTNSPVTGSGTLTAVFAASPTGTGGFVRQISPSLTTPILGVASTTSLDIIGTAGVGFVGHAPQSSAPSSPASGFRQYSDSTGRISWIRSDGFTRTWDATLTANRVYTLPNATTTIAGLSVANIFTLKQTVNLNAAAIPATTLTPVLQLSSTDSVQSVLTFDGFGGLGRQPFIVTRNARGTGASPTAIQSGDQLGFFGMVGATGAGTYAAENGSAGGVFFGGIATENWSGTNQGASIKIYSTATGTAVIAETIRVLSPAIIVNPNIAISAGGTTGVGIFQSSTANLGIMVGSGAPTASAAQGTLYLRTDGSSTSTRLYVNTNGTTGWTNVVTAT